MTRSMKARRLFPCFIAVDEVPAVIETIIDTYLAGRQKDESFAAYVARSGTDALKMAVYDGGLTKARAS